MRIENKILFLVLVSLLALPSLSFAEPCTADVKVCSDGSYVSRSGPSCEFGSCPTKTEGVGTKVDLEKKKRETIKDEIEAKRESIKNSVEERRQNATNKIKERIDQFVQNIVDRYEAAVNRLEKLAERIDSRISKMEADKIDVKKAKELMVTAKSKIATAKTSIASITTTIGTNATTTALMKEEFKAIKIQVEKAKEDIKAAHQALIKVVENLKPGKNKIEKEATSTKTD